MAGLLVTWLSTSPPYFATRLYWSAVTLQFRMPFLTKPQYFGKSRTWGVGLKVWCALVKYSDIVLNIA